MLPREALALGLSLGLAACIVDEQPVESTRRPVISGEQAGPSDYPAVGALINYYGFVCTGTLIAPDLVLTAAHCLESRGSFALEFSLDLDVGDLDYEREHKALTYHRHPGYEPEPEIVDNGRLEELHDVGIVILEQPVEGIEPERLLSPHNSYAVGAGTEAEVVGYGLEVWYEKYNYGIKRTGLIDVEAVVPHELATSGGDFQPCYGDSGGPLFADTPQGRRIIGVVSRAAGDGWRCDTGAIATRVEPYEGWIELARRDREPPRQEAAGCAAGGNGAAGSGLVLLGLIGVLISRSGLRRG